MTPVPTTCMASGATSVPKLMSQMRDKAAVVDALLPKPATLSSRLVWPACRYPLGNVEKNKSVIKKMQANDFEKFFFS